MDFTVDLGGQVLLLIINCVQLGTWQACVDSAALRVWSCGGDTGPQVPVVDATRGLLCKRGPGAGVFPHEGGSCLCRLEEQWPPAQRTRSISSV